ncbi:MAG: VWA domain-containing protein, partial [Firmicutes bacterium]|nr:VWA domain-containing protein [Bacillota bacterium]
YEETNKNKWSYRDISKSKQTYYYKDGNEYYQVTAESQWNLFALDDYWLEANGERLGEVTNDRKDTAYVGTLYTRVSSGSTPKIKALKSAVNNFIASVAANAQENELEHQISIVKFAGDKTDNIGNDTYKESYGYGHSDYYTYNYTQVVKGLTTVDNSDNVSALTDAVKSLSTGGATRADLGLELAQGILEDTASGRDKIVIMFTDGSPTSSRSFEGSVAATAVNIAKEMKDDKTRIFTIGVFDNNDPSDDVENYMNAVSANYPEAEAKNNEGDASWQNLAIGTRAEGDYYYTASDAGELEDIFQLIQEEISTLAITADESSVLSDTVSEYFLLDSTAEDISVNAVPFVGVDSNGNYLWGDAVNIQNDVEVTITGNKLEVTGFDYTDNAVTIKTEDDAVTYSGQKLQIGFTIKANPDAEWEKGTNIVPTNDTGNNKAGVTYTAEDSPKRAELEQSPTVAIAAYEVTYAYNGTIPAGAPAEPQARAYLHGTTVTVEDAPNLDDYSFTGWSAVENIVTPDGNGQFAMPATDVAFSGSWEAMAPPAPETITIPIHKIIDVKRGTPNAPTFSFEAFVPDYQQQELGYHTLATVSLTTGRTADVDLTLDLEELSNNDYFYLREVDDNTSSRWDYDDTVYLVRVEPQEDTDIAITAEIGYQLSYTPGTIESGDFVASGDDVEAATFTNTYTGPSGGKNYVLSYESNGGTKYKDETYAAGTIVKLDKQPQREGYSFTGWYADKKCSQKITTIKMTSDKTVYAGWEKTTTPAMLNDDDHFAYVIGYPDGLVHPEATITRAEVATIFFRLLDDEVRSDNITKINYFSDVAADDWFNTAVSTLSKLQILTGYPDGSFGPNDPITRAEFAAIAARFDTHTANSTAGFSDIQGHWALAEINKAAENGWVNGYPDNTFRPDNNITRAEAMAMINRVLNRDPATPNDLLDDMIKWPDNMDTNQWYYLDIQEATNSHYYERKSSCTEYWTQIIEAPNLLALEQ